MFSHNGVIDGWPDSVAPWPIALPPAVLMTLDAPTDSAFLWALVREHLREGRSAATALAEVVADVLALAPRSRLNLLLNDGQHIAAATTVSHALWVLKGEDSVTVSSEALDPDDRRWQAVPDLCLLEATATSCSIRALADPAGLRATPALIHTLFDPPPVRSTPLTKDGHDRTGNRRPPDPRPCRALAAPGRTPGLTANPKWLQPKWFYDARGSDLFEEITRLPEYYPTRAESSILGAHAGDIARHTGAHTLVELGSGSSEKTRLLLDALQEAGTLRQYVPLDVSETALREAVAAIHGDYPTLAIHGVVADFTAHLDRIPGQTPRLVAFLGGTIGNFLPDERADFLGALRDTLVPGDWLLLGTDLVKDPGRAGRRRTTTRPASPRTSTATSLPCSTGSLARTSTLRTTSTWPSGTRRTSGSR